MRIKVLGTGKKYKPSCLINKCILIEIPEKIDKILNLKELINITDILITHGHSDSIKGIPKLSNLIKFQSSQVVNIHAHIDVIKLIKLRYSEYSFTFNFQEIHPKYVYNIKGLKVKPVLVDHDPKYPTFGYSINNNFFFAPDMSSKFNTKYIKDNTLIIIDGTKCDQENKLSNHIDIVKDVDKIISLNNKYTLFLHPDSSFEADNCINKFLKSKKLINREIRLVNEKEIFNINDKKTGTIKLQIIPSLNTKEKGLNIEEVLMKKGNNPNYTKKYQMCKKLKTLDFSHSMYIVEPVIKGDSKIVVDKKNKLIYECIITPSGKEVITDLLAHNNVSLINSPLITRITYLEKYWNSLLVPKYLPKRTIVSKEKLPKILKRFKKYEQLIIRPLSSKYYEGKFIVKFDIVKVIGRTSLDREHYHRFVVEHVNGMGQTGQRIGKGALHKHQIRAWIVLPTHKGGHTHKLIPDKSKSLIFKPAPDITLNYIRWRLRNPKLFVKDSFRTIHLSKRMGISTIIGKFKREPKGPTHVQSVLFKKSKWTVSRARKWIKNHRSQLKELVVGNSSKLTTFIKEIDLPKDRSNPTLVEQMIQKILGVSIFKQSVIIKDIPFYKVSLYSKALDLLLKEKEKKIIDLRWGETYIPATYELLETKRGTKERLLTCGYILVKGETPVVIKYSPSFSCQVLKLHFRQKDVEKIETFIKNLDKYVKENNYWKNEKITPFGKFLPLTKIKQSDVILDKEITNRLEKTVYGFFKNKEKYEKAKIPFKRGVIFSGLPGTGKTLTGKIIMNNTPNTTFIWVTAKAFKGSSVSYLFDMARELQPAVLFIEDVDRCLTGSNLDAIKTQMDGLESNEGMLTILSTNFPKQLPKTLIDRPGRFDDIIEFKLPNKELRFKILEYYSKNINIDNKEVTLTEIAKLSEGLTPSHLKEIIVSTYMNNEEIITFENLKNSLERIKNLHTKFKAITKERGQGQGNGGTRQGDGGANYCICPKCGTKIEHKKGKPCKEFKCPKCGTLMIGKENNTKTKKPKKRNWRS